jgi:hypothetical protein
METPSNMACLELPFYGFRVREFTQRLAIYLIFHFEFVQLVSKVLTTEEKLTVGWGACEC